MKNKLLLFFCIISFSLNSMEICSCLKRKLSYSPKKQKIKNASKKKLTENKPQFLWIQTNDNHLIVCNKPIITESAWFLLAHETNLFNKEKPLPINISYKNFNIFIHSILNPKTIGKLDTSQQDELLSTAYYLKAQSLYAYFINTKLPSDISAYCGQLIIPINKIQNLLIKNIIKNTCLDSKDYLLKAISASSSFAIKYTNNPDVCIIQAPIKKSFYGCPLYISIIMNIQNGEILHSINNYKLCIPHPTENIIIFAQPISSNMSELLVYNFDNNKIISLKSEPISTFIYSSNGMYFAATHPNKNFITLWHQKSLTFTHLNKHIKPVDIIAFNPDSTHLISGSTESENSIISWNLSNKKSKTILSHQKNHFKSFIFNKEGTVLLVVPYNTTDSFLISLNNNKFTKIKTPFYAFYNVPFIPEEFFKEKTDNGYNLHDHYSLLAFINKNIYKREPLIKINPFNQSYLAVYDLAVHEKKSDLTLYTISSNNVKDKVLTTKYIHSIEFNKHNFLLAACNHEIKLWDKKGNELKTINTESSNHYIKMATFSSNGEYILSLTSTQSSSDSSSHYFFNVIPIINKEFEKNNKIITKNFSTQQALILKKLIKQNKDNNNNYIIKSAFEKQIMSEIKPKIEILFNNKLTITDSNTI